MEPIEKIKFLRNWREALRKLNLERFKEVYVFGSVVSGKITGASDIDLILVIKRGEDKNKALIGFFDEVESKLGEKASYLFDVKVIYEDEKELPLYKFFLRDAVRVK
ncbi:nucleotidyltransferase family protein [Saccharolobus caldissimus]|uniref:DNA polymerase subunit beta n=1 Tax=Saccharolobus caldissimus TaxID=1702097 RepID=A0AAQ4CTL8_9CREN|nr:nucleotidyltransferase domain-containing protein [Saccharolobus caldissimus]BDB99149.1 DNA polymerase subunit beta [Saccharolobus caldissimus]